MFSEENAERSMKVALEAYGANLLRLLDDSADGTLVVDYNNVVRFVNRAAARILGRQGEDLLGRICEFPVCGGEDMEIELSPPGKTSKIAEMRVVRTQWSGEYAYLAMLRDITEHPRGFSARLP